MVAEVQPLTEQECLDLLGMTAIGRVAVVHESYPVVVPVNYRIVQREGMPVVLIRTRTGNMLDHRGAAVGFEVDGIAADGRSGWSVLVRGVLREAHPDADHDPAPAIGPGRDAWLAVVPWAMSGRRVVADPPDWPFDPRGYL